MKKLKIIDRIIIGVFVFIILMLLLANLSTPFADFYVQKIYPVLMKCAAICSPLPFSVGEIIIIILVCVLLLGILAFAPLMAILKTKRKKVLTIYARTISVTATLIMLPITLNCLVMYKTTSFTKRYLEGADKDLADVAAIYNMMALKASELSYEVKRDEHDYFILSDDLSETAKKSMLNISDEYSQLEGYYPNPKPIANSFLMSQEYLTGIFLPFTLEANYNDDMCDINLPFTVCHELAHLKGIMSEDEANFIAFLACINSESVDFQYSGYINMLEYLESYTNVLAVSPDIVAMHGKVYMDMYSFLPENYWEENEEKEIIPTEVVETIADTANDTYLKANGETQGIETYSMVVDLVLEYYSINPLE